MEEERAASKESSLVERGWAKLESSARQVQSDLAELDLSAAGLLPKAVAGDSGGGALSVEELLQAVVGLQEASRAAGAPATRAIAEKSGASVSNAGLLLFLLLLLHFLFLPPCPLLLPPSVLTHPTPPPYVPPCPAPHSAAEEESVAALAKRDAEMRRIEKRLATVEAAIGTGFAGGRASGGEVLPAPSVLNLPELAAAVLQLEEKAALVEATSSDVIVERLERLAAGLGHAESRSKETKGGAASATSASSSSPLMQQIRSRELAKVTDAVERWDPVVHTLPALLRRLHTLHGLHARSTAFSSRLDRLEAAQDGIDAAMEEGTAMLKAVEEGMVANAQIVEGNVRSLEERISALESAS